jgi:succinate dehydrogenase flavin-adding protein (antitoxin of CptAB toxin-antitoxin module)
MNQITSNFHATLCKKLRYQSRYRGSRELDIILSPILQKIESLDRPHLDLLTNVLNEPEHMLYDWLVSGVEAPEHYQVLIHTFIKGCS